MENPSRPIALSKSVVLTKKGSIPSLLLLGKIVSGGSPAESAFLLPEKLRQIWGASGTVNFVSVTDDAFLVQFHEAEDLAKAHDGAPWSCDGHGLFLMQHVKPRMNLVDQIAGLTKAELWLRFHGVPAEYFCADSVHDLAEAIGELVSCDLSRTFSLEFLRARVLVDITRPLQRSVDVTLSNGDQESVSVEYEGVPSLCRSCGILGHPADRCPRRANQPAAAAAAPRPAAVYSPSHLGPRRPTSGASSSLGRGKSPRRYEVDNPPVLPATAPAPPALRSWHERLPSINRSSLNFWKPKTWRKVAGKNKSPPTGDHDSQDKIAPPSNQEEENHVLETNSAQESVQDPSIMEAQETQLHATPITPSYSIVKARGSRSTENARIEVMVETHCSPQLLEGAMRWLSQKAECTGWDAKYDGRRGVISIFGLQIDQNMDPVDLIAYMLPKIMPKTGLGETQTKPDSPARFANTLMHFHDVMCCKDDSKELGKNWV